MGSLSAYIDCDQRLVYGGCAFNSFLCATEIEALMVKIYIWKPKFSIVRAGHAAMWIIGGEPLGDIYISWWPLGNRWQQAVYTAWSGDSVLLHTRLDQDCTEECRLPDQSVLIDGLDETKIKFFWTRWQQQGHYQALLFNCATTVAEALREGGADKLVSNGLNKTVWFPQDVLYYATSINSALAVRRSA
jgi:hypothetical protein